MNLTVVVKAANVVLGASAAVVGGAALYCNHMQKKLDASLEEGTRRIQNGTAAINRVTERLNRM